MRMMTMDDYLAMALTFIVFGGVLFLVYFLDRWATSRRSNRLWRELKEGHEGNMRHHGKYRPLIKAATEAATVMEKHIHPMPDRPPDHPWNVLRRLKETLATLDPPS